MHGPEAKKHRAKFDIWAADPDNAAAYAEAKRRFALLDDSSADRVQDGEPQPSRPMPVRWATAFVIALALTFGAAWYLGQARNSPQIAIPSAGPGTIRLADGTLVKLMNGAKVEPRFSDSERRVVMIGGRARFTVAHDASRPFRVVAGDSEVVALGTVFEVDLTRVDPVIRLVTGSVEVRAPGSDAPAIRLRPGEAAEVRDKQPRLIALSDPKPEVPESPIAPSVAAILPSPRVVADKLPLREVIDRANQINSQPIHLADPALGLLEVTGSFDVSDSASLARKLAAALPLNVEQMADAITLTRK
jgi:transmembrane sensor